MRKVLECMQGFVEVVAVVVPVVEVGAVEPEVVEVAGVVAVVEVVGVIFRNGGKTNVKQVSATHSPDITLFLIGFRLLAEPAVDRLAVVDCRPPNSYRNWDRWSRYRLSCCDNTRIFPS